MSNWTAASSDCSRPANNYVRVNTVDLYTPNARFTPERLGYQVLTLFGKLGYSRRNQDSPLTDMGVQCLMDRFALSHLPIPSHRAVATAPRGEMTVAEIVLTVYSWARGCPVTGERGPTPSLAV